MLDVKSYKNQEDIRQGFKTKLLSEPESLLSRKRQKCLGLTIRNGNGHRMEYSLQNMMTGHRSARKTSLCAESCGRLRVISLTISCSLLNFLYNHITSVPLKWDELNN